VSCDARQEQVSLLIDAELEESDQVTLFGHLENCTECRLFLDSMIRFRNAARRDHEASSLAADEALPQGSRLPLKEAASGHGERRWLRILTRGWRMPASVAIGAAVVLLVAGAIVGTRISTLSGGGGPEGQAGLTSKPAVVVICSLPEVEVLGNASHL
jgi:predicted anti-sigma-YlaC factor YlaD